MANLSATNSANLKTALVNADFGSYAAVEDTRTFYDGNTLYAAHSGSGGYFLATSNNAPPRHFRSDDNALIRAWEGFEIEAFLLSQTPYESGNMTFSYSGLLNANRKCVLTISGQQYEGEQALGALSVEQADLECLAKSVIQYLNSL